MPEHWTGRHFSVTLLTIARVSVSWLALMPVHLTKKLGVPGSKQKPGWASVIQDAPLKMGQLVGFPPGGIWVLSPVMVSIGVVPGSHLPALHVAGSRDLLETEGQATRTVFCYSKSILRLFHSWRLASPPAETKEEED